MKIAEMHRGMGRFHRWFGCPHSRPLFSPRAFQYSYLWFPQPTYFNLLLTFHCRRHFNIATQVLPAGEMPDAEKVADSFYGALALVLSEEQACAIARSSLNESLFISIYYANGNSENPRNGPKWRKWYIICLVSMRNVFTYGGPNFHSLLGNILLKETMRNLMDRWHLFWCSELQEEFGVAVEVTTLCLSL